MALVNIPRDREDPNYRYKMPKLLSKIEGRGNGIRTNIYNMGDIARALKRPPMYPTKFFGCELGAMVKFEESEEKALINGAHNEQDLVKILDKFIQMYVLCGGCELPEIDIIVKKGILTCKCNACGYLGTLDNAHKAATYMVRNPPDCTSTTIGKKKKTKEERRVEKLEKQEKLEKAGKRDERTKDDKAEKKKSKDKKSKKKTVDDDEKGSFENGEATPTNEGEDSLDEGRSSETEKKREKKERRKSDGRKNTEDRRVIEKESLTFDSPEISDVCNRLCSMMERSDGVNPDAFFSELRMLQVSQDFDSKCRLYVVFKVLFNNKLDPNDLAMKMPFILKCCDSSVSAPDIISALEYFYFLYDSTLASYPYILQKLYSAELLEGDDILEYYSKDIGIHSYEKCKKHAEPFLLWLADVESSQDEDDEE